MTHSQERRIPPGPKGVPVLGNARELRADIIQTIMDGWRAHGDIVRFKIPGVAIYVLGHPDYAKHVLQDNHQNYPKIPMVDNKFKRVSGEGLLTSGGSFWLRQRRIMQPVFHRQRIAAYAKLMTDATQRVLDRWVAAAQSGQALDMRVEMMRLSLDVMARALFTADMTRQADVIGQAVTVEFEYLHKRLNALLDVPLKVPIASNRRFLQARESLDAIVYPLIAERRKSGEDTGDFLSMLLQVRDEDTGEGMTDLQVRDELTTFIFAGHETVSTGLTWVWYMLSKHPTAWRRLRAEVEEVLGGRVPTIEDLQRLRYTSMVIDESMRLYPPLWLIARTPLKDDEIAGYHVPKGTFVFCPPYVIHRHPDFWSNPEGFEPERFDPERSAGRHKYAYFPFGNGPRKCIGDYFGLVEMQLVVAMITQRYRLDLVPGHPVVAEPAISLRARDGLLMTLSPAEASGAHGGEGRAAASRTTAAGPAGAGAAGGAR
jgi:cytochrome P450